MYDKMKIKILSQTKRQILQKTYKKKVERELFYVFDSKKALNYSKNLCWSLSAKTVDNFIETSRLKRGMIHDFSKKKKTIYQSNFHEKTLTQ